MSVLRSRIIFIPSGVKFKRRSAWNDDLYVLFSVYQSYKLSKTKVGLIFLLIHELNAIFIFLTINYIKRNI